MMNLTAYFIGILFRILEEKHCIILEEKLHLAQIWGKILTRNGVGWARSHCYSY